SPFQAVAVALFCFGVFIAGVVYLWAFKRCGGIENWLIAHFVATVASGIVAAVYFVISLSLLVIAMLLAGYEV
ncbi:MAG: hypothetical protein AAGL23_17160, partial [Pseudomonadota bacterium]